VKTAQTACLASAPPMCAQILVLELLLMQMDAIVILMRTVRLSTATLPICAIVNAQSLKALVPTASDAPALLALTASPALVPLTTVLLTALPALTDLQMAATASLAHLAPPLTALETTFVQAAAPPLRTLDITNLDATAPQPRTVLLELALQMFALRIVLETPSHICMMIHAPALVIVTAYLDSVI